MLKKICIALFGIAISISANWQAPYDIGIKTKPGFSGYLSAPIMQVDWVYNGFGNEHEEIECQELVFGKEKIEMQDIFLISKLAKNGNTSFTSGDYVSLLSTATVDLDLQEKRYSTAVQASLTGAAFGSQATFTLDMRLPIELCEHTIDASYYGDGISNSIVGNVANFDATSPVYFFVRNVSVESYVKEEILDPKGLKLLKTHRSFGLGSIRIAGVMDFQNCFETRVNKMQAGMVAHLQVPHTDRSNIVWAANHGLGAHYIGFVGETEIEVNPVFTPFAKIETIKSFAHRTTMRVPQQKNGSGDGGSLASHNLKSSDDMVGPTIQRSFSEFDTTVPYFADEAHEFSRTLGASIRLNIGNKILLGDICEIEMWYGLHYKFADVLEATEKTPASLFNYAVITDRTRNISHSVGWKTNYNVADNVMINVGGLYGVSGTNAPRYTTLNAGIEAAF